MANLSCYAISTLGLTPVFDDAEKINGAWPNAVSAARYYTSCLAMNVDVKKIDGMDAAVIKTRRGGALIGLVFLTGEVRDAQDG